MCAFSYLYSVRSGEQLGVGAILELEDMNVTAAQRFSSDRHSIRPYYEVWTAD